MLPVRIPPFSPSEYVPELYTLPRHLKDCALFLAGFPRGSTVDIDVVISSWIAEDLVASRSSGAANVDELINQHLLEPVQTAADGKAESVRVSSLVHDMLAKISYDKGFHTASSRPVSRLDKMRLNRLSLVSENAGFIADINLISYHTRAMILYSCRGVPSLATCKFLRLLLVNQCNDFSDANLKSVVELVYLKAWILNTPLVTKLPRHFHKLQMLESLIIQDSSVTKLSNSIINFEMLTCLKVGEVAFPSGISRLQKLEKLEIFDVGSSAENAVKELGSLYNLKVLSCYWGLSTIKDDIRIFWFETSLAELVAKGKLEELTLSEGNESMARVLELRFFSFDTMMKLRKLCVENHCFMICVPPLISYYLRLAHVSIRMKVIEAEDVAALGHLPSLALLKLWINGPACIEFGKDAFLQLGGVCVSSDGLELSFKEGCLPKLEKLHLVSSIEVHVLGLHEVLSLNALFLSIVGSCATIASVITTAVNEAAAMCEGVRVIIMNEMIRDEAGPVLGEV